MHWCHPDNGWIRVVGPKARPKVRGQIRYFRPSGWYVRWGSGGVNSPEAEPWEAGVEYRREREEGWVLSF